MAVQAMRTILLADAAVVALVGQNIEPVRMDQETTLPAVVLTRVSLVPANHLKGRPTLDSNRVQLDGFATTYAAARQLASACREALELADVVMESEIDNFEPDVSEYRITQDYLTWT
jgi:hypothetical protein